MAITTTELECGGVPAYYAHGTVTGDFGVLLLPSIHGREAYVMDYVQSLAQAGFPTLMWDLFRGEGEAHTREERTARGARLTDAGSAQQISRLLDYMLGELGMKRVVALGFCLGGRYGLVLAAQDHRLAGLVSYYPTIETPRLKSQEWDVVAEAANITCPVHMIVPGNDHPHQSCGVRRIAKLAAEPQLSHLDPIFPECRARVPADRPPHGTCQ